jgi:hypothetical protein
VVKRDHRLDALLDQRVDQLAVEVQPAPVRRAMAVRVHPGPGDAEPVGPHPEGGEQRDILGVPVVVVDGDIAGVAVAHPPGSVAQFDVSVVIYAHDSIR